MLTICTPTFNRAHTLPRVFQSLMQQTVKSFEWIIVDDGSNDNTKEKVLEFTKVADFPIYYIFQENQGKHIAVNQGIEKANKELFTCLDSDDWYYDNAVELILNQWSKVSHVEDIVGIISLDSYENKTIIGTTFPPELTEINWIELQYKYKVTGDKDYFLRTSEIKNVKFPSFPNNKHMPPSYQYYLLSREFRFALLNTPTKYVEYLDDGISKNKFNKYMIAPDNFAKYRYEIMDLIPSINRKVINAIHFNSSIYLGNIKLKPTRFINKLLINFTKPLGYLLSIYIKIKVNKSKNIAHRIEGNK